MKRITGMHNACHGSDGISLGGYAWDNTELATPDWLWYSFLRTGDKDLWRMAEAMTRHNSEVDTYHIGDMAGLGTRHNVSHWGCGAKEARISQADIKNLEDADLVIYLREKLNRPMRVCGVVKNVGEPGGQGFPGGGFPGGGGSGFGGDF